MKVIRRGACVLKQRIDKPVIAGTARGVRNAGGAIDYICVDRTTARRASGVRNRQPGRLIEDVVSDGDVRDVAIKHDLTVSIGIGKCKRVVRNEYSVWSGRELHAPAAEHVIEDIVDDLGIDRTLNVEALVMIDVVGVCAADVVDDVSIEGQITGRRAAVRSHDAVGCCGTDVSDVVDVIAFHQDVVSGAVFPDSGTKASSDIEIPQDPVGGTTAEIHVGMAGQGAVQHRAPSVFGLECDGGRRRAGRVNIHGHGAGIGAVGPIRAVSNNDRIAGDCYIDAFLHGQKRLCAATRIRVASVCRHVERGRRRRGEHECDRCTLNKQVTDLPACG